MEISEEQFLFSVIDVNDELVLEELLKCNVNLIHKICHKYVNCGIPYEDLFSSGMIGLVVAAKKFDISKGNRFTTYCYYWIMQKIQRCVENNGSVIRLPAHIGNVIRKIEKADDRSLLGLVELTGKTIGNVKNALGAMDLDILSIDNRGEDNDYSFHDVVVDDSSDPLFDNLLEKEKKEIVKNALENLGESERLFIMFKFGIGADKCNDNEIMEILGIDKSMFNEIKSNAFSILRQDKDLIEYFDVRKEWKI